MATCPKCGTESTMNFCPNCGAQMGAAAPAGAVPVPPAPPAAQAAAATMAPPPAPPAMGQYAPPAQQYQPAPQYQPYQQYPQYPGAAVPAQGSLWQGILVLVLGLLTAAFLGLGVLGNTGDPDFATIKLGGEAIAVVLGVLVLIFGIWGLIKNRTAGKIMAGIGLVFWLLTTITVFVVK